MKDFLLKKMALPTVVLVWAASYYVEVMGYSEKNHRLIQPVFWIMVLLYVINGITDYREWKSTQTEPAEDTSSPKPFDRKIIAVIVAMVAYVVLLNIFGFVISTLLFVAAVLFLMGERRWYLLIGIPIALVAVLYVVFRIALSIPLPIGFLGF